MAEMQARYRRGVAAIDLLEPVLLRDTAEIQPRYSRDTAEIQPRYSRELACSNSSSS